MSHPGLYTERKPYAAVSIPTEHRAGKPIEDLESL
jgi:hypothetical protein